MPEFYDTPMDNPYDADYNFSFLDIYIANAGRKAARPNDQVIENDGSFYDMDDEVEQVEAQAETEALQTEGTKVSEEDFMNEELFADEDSPYVKEYLSQSYNPTSQAQMEIANQYVQTSGAVEYKPGVSTQGWKPKVASIVDGLSEMVGNVVVTSTVRSKEENDRVGGQKNSFHLSGDAVDLRPNKNLDAFLSSSQGKAYLAAQGYEVIDERGKRSGSHWHLEPAKRQYGGNVAKTKKQQFIGLNDESLDDLFLPLQGTNIIRGLDSGEPVHVTDENGMEAVLYGPEDTVMMSGGVKEKRLKYQTGGDVQEEVNWLHNWYSNRKPGNRRLAKQIEKERPARLANMDLPYKISNDPADIGEDNIASYTPGERVFNLPPDLDQGNNLHEATHMSDDFDERPTAGIENRAIKKSLPSRKQYVSLFGATKKEGRDYFEYISDPGEVKARLMQLRKKAGFAPDQDVSEEQLQKFFDDTEGEADQNIDELMDFIRAGGKKGFNKKVLNLLNNTVSIQRPDSNLA